MMIITYDSLPIIIITYDTDNDNIIVGIPTILPELQDRLKKLFEGEVLRKSN